MKAPLLSLSLIAATLVGSDLAAQSNLIVNGDFESGDTGFQSQYTAGFSGAETYEVLDNPRNKNPLFVEMGDHTSGDGLMMVINGSTQDDAPAAWSQVVEVDPFTNHTFSLWAANLFGASPSRIELRINGVALGDPISVDPQLGEWNEHTRTWDSGEATAAQIEIVFLSLEFGGNDTALDDISFIPDPSPCLNRLFDPEQFTVIQSDPIIVPGISNPFLAGQPDGVLAKSDTSPDHSPVFAESVRPGDVLSFVVEGSVSNQGFTPGNPPDGGVLASSASELGIGGYTERSLPVDALVGVFLGDGIPQAPAPAEIIYSGDSLDFELLAPRLHQIFYIGDGLTGDGIGRRQEFVVPPGATRLYLGVSDSFEWSDNSGSFEVKICRLTEIVEGSELVPTTIRFDRDLYQVEAGQPVEGDLLMEPMPDSGLYSQGMLLEVRDRSGSFAGVVSPVPTGDLDFDGVLDENAAVVESGSGTGGVKGSARFSSGLPLRFDPTIASFRIESLPGGTYDLTLRAWNELGPTEDIFVTGSSLTLDPVITFGTAVAEVEGGALPTTVEAGEIMLNRQTGLLEQTVTVTNDTGGTIDGFRLFIRNLPEGVEVWNAHGTIDGVPYFDTSATLGPGESIDILIEYYRPSRDPGFAPSFEVAEVGDPGTRPDEAVPLDLDLRIVRFSSEGLLLEFLTEDGAEYTIEYSDDMQNWRVAQPVVIIGTGTRLQWLDSGPPKTETAPAGNRFYRIFQNPPQP